MVMNEKGHLVRLIVINHVPELGVRGVDGRLQPLQEEVKIRRHVDKVCSL